MPRFSKAFLQKRKTELDKMLRDLLDEQNLLCRNIGLDHEVLKDPSDLANATLSQDMNILITNGCENKISLIAWAIQAIDEDNYGVCSECGKEISEKRLRPNVVPWATTCVNCQADTEQHQKDLHTHI